MDSLRAPALSNEEVLTLRRDNVRLRQELEKARSSLLDAEDDYRRIESQHEILEAFCFTNEQEHKSAMALVSKTQAELAASYALLRSLKEQQDDILRNVQQGIMTLNAEGLINAECSAKALEIFGRETLGGVSLYALFAEDPKLVGRLRRFFDVLFGNPWLDVKMVQKINPLAECYYRAVGASNEQAFRVLAFRFFQIRQSEAAGPRNTTRVVKVMAVVEDRTVEYLLNQELERQTREQSAKVEKVYQILMLPPEVFRSFVEDARGAAADAVAYLPALRERQFRDAGLVNPCLRILHTIKGNARALNLESVAKAAHLAEDALQACLENRDDVPRADAYASSLQRVLHEVEDGSLLFERILNVRGAFQDRSISQRHELEDSLRALVQKEALALGKQVEFSYREDVGDALPVRLVSQLRTAMIQAVRNAVAHGIETAQTRVARGKAPVGHVSVTLSREGAVLNASCRDDGAGLDTERLREAAVRKSLLSEVEARGLSDDAARELIFLPGFSTMDSVTQSAGRGIGMDVVRASAKALGGDVLVRSEVAAFTEIRFVVPVDGTDVGSGI